MRLFHVLGLGRSTQISQWSPFRSQVWVLGDRAARVKTMPAFTLWADRDDQDRLKVYILQRVPPSLKIELDAYLLYRTETCRQGLTGLLGRVHIHQLSHATYSEPKRNCVSRGRRKNRKRSVWCV